MSLSTVLKSRRKELGLTLNDIAQYMDVSEATVQRWESGNIKNLRQGRVAKLADILNVSPAKLMGWETDDLQSAQDAEGLLNGYSGSKVTDDKELLKAIDQYYTLSEKEQKLVLDLIDALAQNK